MGIAHAAAGDSALARVQLDSARVFLEQAVRDAPHDHRLHFTLSGVYAGLGQAGGGAGGLVTIFVLFPAPLAWGRIAASVLMVVLVAPLMAKLAESILQRRGAAVHTLPLVQSRAPGISVGDADLYRDEPLGEAVVGALRSWWWASVALAYRLFLPMTGAIFLAAVFRLFLPPQLVETYLGGGLIAVMAIALFGTLIAIPTMFEIPLALGFLFLGMGIGPAAALLVTAPSVSIVSYFMLRKDIGHLPPLLLLAATFVMGTTVGMVVDTLF